MMMRFNACDGSDGDWRYRRTAGRRIVVMMRYATTRRLQRRRTLQKWYLRKMHIDNIKVNLCQHILHQMIFSA